MPTSFSEPCSILSKIASSKYRLQNWFVSTLKDVPQWRLPQSEKERSSLQKSFRLYETIKYTVRPAKKQKTDTAKWWDYKPQIGSSSYRSSITDSQILRQELISFAVGSEISPPFTLSALGPISFTSLTDSERRLSRFIKAITSFRCKWSCKDHQKFEKHRETNFQLSNTIQNKKKKP